MENTAPPLGPRAATPVEEIRPPGQGRVLAALRDSPEALTLGGLSELSGLHPNTLRGHLDALMERGEVTRSPSPAHGRGRPAWQYAALGPDSGHGGELAGLAVALARAVIRTSEDPVDAARQAGREWGLELAAEMSTPDDEADPAIRAFDQMGFAPEGREDRVVRLTRCPLLPAARAEPDVVCGVHQGLAQGLLEAAGVPTEGIDLVPFAERGACLLTLPAGPRR